ncbi:MAG: phosphatase PAP2 family protein [Anaerolineales bacterium]|nr:phosphatase PAP2 family protein [Anaerolineales bacterium]
MQNWIDSGVGFVIALQNIGTWLNVPMQFFSQLGTEDFFFLVLPLIYWSIDSALGLRVGLILATSSMFNYAGKLLFAGPRPYWVSSHVQALWPETTFGAPSGHAQHAMSVWGMIALYRNNLWVRVVCFLLIFLIGFSRIYLGSHFPHDVIFGWLFGAILLWAFVRFWEPVAAWLRNKSFRQHIWISFIASLILMALGLSVTALRSNFQTPSLWIDNTLLAGTEIPAPIDANNIFTSAGTFFGLALGVAWIHVQGGYQADGPAWKRVLRYVIGLIGVLILWMGLGEIFPRGDGVLVYSLRFIRYTLVGFWITGGAPWVFKHFNLTTSSARKPSV